MNQEQQVCSLELAKRLMELGVKQESYFTWVGEELWDTTMLSDYETPRTSRERISAFTVAELGEMLPGNFNGLYTRFQKGLMGNRWFATLHKVNGNRQQHQEEEKTEADARAKMLIHLLENKLITS